MLSSLVMMALALAPERPPLESDQQNVEACRAAAAGLPQRERVQSQLQCRDDYFRRVKAARARLEAAAQDDDRARAVDEAAQKAARAAAWEEEKAAKVAAREAEEARTKPIRDAAAAEANARWAAEEKAAAQLREAAAAAEEQRAAAAAAAEQAQEARDQAALAAQEKACGADLMRVEVGMAWERVKACAGPFTVVGQVQRPEGVVSVFRAPGGVVQVLGGKVVAWRRSR